MVFYRLVFHFRVTFVGCSTDRVVHAMSFSTTCNKIVGHATDCGFCYVANLAIFFIDWVVYAMHIHLCVASCAMFYTLGLPLWVETLRVIYRLVCVILFTMYVQLRATILQCIYSLWLQLCVAISRGILDIGSHVLCTSIMCSKFAGYSEELCIYYVYAVMCGLQWLFVDTGTDK